MLDQHHVRSTYNIDGLLLEYIGIVYSYMLDRMRDTFRRCKGLTPFRLHRFSVSVDL